MKVRRKNEDEYRTIHTAVMQTDAERAELQEMADALGMTMSRVMRRGLALVKAEIEAQR